MHLLCLEQFLFVYHLEYQKQVLENIEKSRLKKEEEDKARSLEIQQDAATSGAFDYLGTGFDSDFYNQ